MRDFKELLDLAKTRGPKTISVAVAEDEDVLEAIKLAMENNIVTPILVGNKKEILRISREVALNIENLEIINEVDDKKAAIKAVELVDRGKADILMKGLVSTSTIMKAVLDKDKGLRTNKLISHAAVFEVDTYHKVFLLSDAAMIIAPDLEEKRSIIENTIELAKSLDISKPKVGVLAANEKVSEKMEATVHAEKLKNMNTDGYIVDGPFALDNAISKESADIKGIKSEVAGDVDILLAPNIETGNVLYKALSFLANAKTAGIILGAKAPIVLTSRADNEETKLNSIALAVLMAAKEG